MNKPEPSIRVNVDITNPGQFFACCGLLELASKIDQYALSCFNNGCFEIYGNTEDVLERLFTCAVEVDTSVKADTSEDDKESEEEDELDPHRGRIYPMTLGSPFNLRLDWWTSVEAQEQKLKTWTAGQMVTDLFLNHHKRKGKKELCIPSMREHFSIAVKQHPNDWLRTPMPIEAPSAFSYDSRLSRNNALDMGHTEAGVLAFSPAIDVLALIGFQRFRPLMIERWSRNLFCTWRETLPVEIAVVAALGLIPHLIDKCFEFPVIRRDTQGRFKLFGHAQPSRRPHV